MTLRSCWLGALLVLASSCSAPREQQLPSAPGEEVMLGNGRWRLPAAVGDAIKQERLDLTLQDVKLADVEGSPSVKVTALDTPEVWPSPRKGVAYFRAELDEGVTSECVVRSDRLDVAQAFHNAFEEMEQNPALGIRQTDHVEQQPVDGWPVLFVRVQYLTPSRQYGSVRMAATNVNDHGLFCTVDAPGHEKTFGRLIFELVGSLRAQVPDRAARRSFHWVQIDDRWTGVVENVERVRPDGTHVDMSFASLLKPAAADLTVADEVNVEVTNPEGELMMWRTVRQVDGKMHRDLVLTTTGTRHVALKGTDDNKPREEDLGALPPSTGRDMRAHYQQALQGTKAGPRVFLRYYPGVEPESLAEETVELVGQSESGGSFRSIIRTPNQQVESEYDIAVDGEMVRSVIRTADSVVTLIRVPR